MKIDDKIDLLLLDSVISTYEQAVRSQNISVKKHMRICTICDICTNNILN